MALEIIYGDLFNQVVGKEAILVHGCNAAGAFGAGVAGLVRKLYPFAYKAYMAEKHRLHLGQIIIASDESSPVIVVNAVTQARYGNDGSLYVNYDAVVESMQATAKWAKEKKLPVFLPLVGAGLGGGDKFRLISILQAAFYDVDATLVLVE